LVDHRTISIGSLIGFFAVFAIALRECVLLLDRYQALARRDRTARPEGIARRATRERVGPVVLTLAGAVGVFLPVLVFGGRAGFELVHPMAAVVVGGLVTVTLSTLVLVPALCERFGPLPAPRRAEAPPARPAPADGANGDRELPRPRP